MSGPRGLSLAAKSALVVTIPVAALLLAMVVFYQFERQMQHAEVAVESTYEARGELPRLLMQIANAETGIRGYLLTRRTAFLEPFYTALEELPPIRANLRRLLADSPSQLERLSRAEERLGDVLAAMQRSRDEVARGNEREALAELDADKAAMDALRAELDVMVGEAQKLLAARTAKARRAEQLTSAAIFSGGAFGLLGAIAAALVFTRHIGRRIRHLEVEALDVAAGRPILHEVRGDDEIARLERTLKRMSELLAARAAELRQIHDELESRVEAAVEEREAVFRSSPLAIWAVDLEGKVLQWNPAAERIFGWTAAETIGKPVPVIRASDWPEYREWLTRFSRGESFSGVERKRRRKDGAEIDVVLWTAPLCDRFGGIRGALAIDSDISQQKLLEEQFRQSQKLEAVGRLAGGIAHDFNNLLTVIQGYTDMVAIQAEHRAPELLEYTREIDYASGRAAALTAQLLAFSRRQISQPRILDLNDIVTHSMKLLRRVIGEDIEVDLRLDGGLGRVKADPIHIDQLIMNLVVNARDAMGSGGCLTIETRNERLDTEYAGRHIGVAPGSYCLLAIGDNGAGMTAETRARLFEPFFTTKEAGKGTGLGLSIVYGIVKQNHGEIMVYSEPGIGTTFKVYLPRVEAPAEVAAAEQAALALYGSETVLLCEDEQQIRDLVEHMLKRQGYRVLTAAAPDEALAIALREPFHLVLTDVVMPRMSGFDLVRELAALRPGIKWLFMSGYTDTQIMRGRDLTEGVEFLQKPFSAAALSSTVRRVLDDTTSRGGLPLPS